MWGVIGTWYFAIDPAREAAKMLAEGATSMDALIRLATMVEDDPTVDAVGYGGFLNSNGELEMDAAVMDGESMNLGCVAGIKNVKIRFSLRATCFCTAAIICLSAPARTPLQRSMAMRSSIWSAPRRVRSGRRWSKKMSSIPLVTTRWAW